MQGLSGKELELSLFLEGFNVHVLCLTEHWLKEPEILFLNDSKYTVQSAFVRKNAIRGGSLILVSNELKCKQRQDLVNLSVERTIELSCVELERYVIICVYRPPTGDFNIFESVIEDLFNKLKSNNKRKIICGDFNVNILEVDSPLSIRLVNLFKSYNLVNLFFEPTRITATSSTCLDNIFCDCAASSCMLLNNLTSDHCGQSACFPMVIHKKPFKIECRPVTASRCSRFKSNINKKLKPSILANEDPNVMYGSLFDVVEKEFNSTFKTKTMTVNATSANFNKWATEGIYKSRARLYELYLRYENVQV